MHRLAAGWLLLWACTVHAGDVLVLRSRELPAYRAVQAGFTAALQRPVRELPLADAAGLERALAARPELVLAVGLEAARAMVGRAPGVPLVCALVPAPEQLGAELRAVPMFASPERQLLALRAVLPRARRLGAFFDAAHPPAQRDAYARAARAAGLELIWAEVGGPEQLSVAARELASRVDVLWLLPDAELISAQSFRFLVELSFARKRPLLGFSQSMVKAGALLALEPGYEQMGRRAAGVAQQLLARRAASAAPEDPADPLFLNARAAALLGVTLEPGTRARAAHVFE